MEGQGGQGRSHNEACVCLTVGHGGWGGGLDQWRDGGAGRYCAMDGACASGGGGFGWKVWWEGSGVHGAGAGEVALSGVVGAMGRRRQCGVV